MPGEPVVVLHTALEHKISNNIQVSDGRLYLFSILTSIKFVYNKYISQPADVASS